MNRSAPSRRPAHEDLRPWARDLIEVVEAPALECPQEAAAYLCHHGAEPETLTWGGLWRAARRVGAHLRALGVGEGDRVLLVLPTSRAFIETFFGVLVAGAVPVPTAPPPALRGASLKPHLELLRNMVEDSGAALCVSWQDCLEAIGGSLREAGDGLRLLAVETLPESGLVAERARPAASDAALLQYTSGSTSRPKGVELSHGNILANAAAISELIVDPSTVGFSWLPMYHDMGLIGTLLTGLYSRSPVAFMPPVAFIKNPALWLRGISDYRATVTVAPSFAFDYCVRNLDLAELDGVRLDTLRIALNGAEPVDPMAIERFQETFQPLGLADWVVRPVYGLAESSLAVTFSDPGPPLLDRVDADALEGRGLAPPAANGARSRVFVSVGRQVPTQEVRIVDREGGRLPERTVGEIVVRGPSVMKGYYNRPRATRRALRDGWLHTGDLGYLADGRLYITGRRKEVIIRNGRNYYPQDIEALVARVAGVLAGRAVAFGVEAEAGTRTVVVAEVRARQREDLEEIERQIRQRITEALLFGPDDVLLVRLGTIPRTTSGKVRRRECRRRYLDGEVAARRVRPPRSPRRREGAERREDRGQE